MPSRENSVSMSSDPVKKAPMNAAGRPVMIGIRALRNTCFQRTFFSGTPLARAVSTYCLRISSSTEFLTSMVITANPPTTMAVTGSAICRM